MSDDGQGGQRADQEARSDEEQGPRSPRIREGELAAPAPIHSYHPLSQSASEDPNDAPPAAYLQLPDFINRLFVPEVLVDKY
ncbi:hypothetical protein D1B32_23485, partial [Oceanobacillus profundus]